MALAVFTKHHPDQGADTADLPIRGIGFFVP